MICPLTRRKNALSEIHGAQLGGHFGVTKTLKMDEMDLSRKCVECSVSKGPQTRKREPMKQYSVGTQETNQEASTIAQILVDNIFRRLGVPMAQQSVSGRNFE